MIQSQRYAKIEELVTERGIVNTREMAMLLNVTETTIRRDYEGLERMGKLVRVHGGAKSLEKKMVVTTRNEKEMKERTENAAEKEAVCKRAAGFVQDGACVFLDGGTSIVPMISYLKNKKVKIVTNSLLVANSFQESEAEMFLIGGSYIPKYNMSIGPLAISGIQRFNFDYAFISCVGADVKRNLMYTAEVETMAVKEAAMNLAAKSILLLDSSKLFIKGFCSLISLKSFDFIICNSDTGFSRDELPENFLLENVEPASTI